MATGYWDTVFDPRFMLHREVNEWNDIQDLQDQTADAAAQLRQLTKIATAAHRQLYELSITTGVLVKMLAEANLLDVEVLRTRAEAELAAARAQPPPPVVIPDPWASAPAQAAVQAAPPAAAPVTCPLCGKQVPANQTTITARGTVCDGCAATQR
ncbi:MAG TPA: hypothetical protein VLX92_02080 [Kofleriaceae bacterium]|nr:hypothetical protein [Kofleriaceae bacterium]